MIIEHTSKQVQQITYHLLNGNDEYELLDLFENHPELNSSFNEVLISYNYPQSVLAPSHLSSFENAGTMIDSLYGYSIEKSVISETIPEWQISNSYAVPNQIHEILSTKYSKGKFWHDNSISLKTVLSLTGHDDALIIDFIPGQFSVSAMKNGHCQLIQKITYKNAEDLIYFLVKICAQLSLDRQTVNVFISGLIDQESVLFYTIQNYFVNIQFRKIPEGFILDENMASHPDHYFVSLFNLTKCV